MTVVSTMGTGGRTGFFLITGLGFGFTVSGAAFTVCAGADESTWACVRKKHPKQSKTRSKPLFNIFFLWLQKYPNQ